MKVKKNLSDEEKQLVNNIMSGLQNLLSMGSADDGEAEMAEDGEELTPEEKKKQEEEEAKKAEDAAAEDKKKEDEAAKAKKAEGSDGSDANDDASTIIDENTSTDINDKSLPEVAKALFGQSVKKQKRQITNSEAIGLMFMRTAEAIEKVAKAQEAQAANSLELEKALQHVFDGLGITQSVKKAQPKNPSVQKSNSPQGIQLQDVVGLMQVLQQAGVGAPAQKSESGLAFARGFEPAEGDVYKDMTSMLEAWKPGLEGRFQGR